MVSKSLGSGLSLAQLAFLWGRQLTLFRPEHHVAVFFPTVEELTSLVRAALVAGECPGLPMADLNPAFRKLAKDLKRKMHPGSYGRLCAASQRVRPDALERLARDWLRTLELTGGRAGLLACGDVSVAAELVQKHPQRGQTREEEQVSDLMSFSVSDEYTKLRRRLGVAIA
jgi:hypothetical protein